MSDPETSKRITGDDQVAIELRVAVRSGDVAGTSASGLMMHYEGVLVIPGGR